MDWFAPLRRTAWGAALAPALGSPEVGRLAAFLDAESTSGADMLPRPEQIFRAYALVPPEAVRIVIVGQDPYPTPGHAHGLAFSYVGRGSCPRSLGNIFRELEADLDLPRPARGGDLSPWARQGVLLLNTVLTVRAGEAGSHRGQGWEHLTGATIDVVAALPQPVAFLLWGRVAQRFAPRIQAPHTVLEAGHPSPLSVRYFQGCRPFSRANAFLGERAIEWNLAPAVPTPRAPVRRQEYGESP